MSCCVHLARAILPAHSSSWRERFKDLYGTPQRRSSSELKLEYQIRSIVLSQKINFRYGQKQEQTLWLEVLRDMLLEAYESAPTDEHTASKLLGQIHKTLHNSEFLNRPVSGYGDTNTDAPSELFYAVQLVSPAPTISVPNLDTVSSNTLVPHPPGVGPVYGRLLPQE